MRGEGGKAVLARAVALAGGIDQLAAQLDVREAALQRYLAGDEGIPDELYLKLVDVVLKDIPTPRGPTSSGAQARAIREWCDQTPTAFVAVRKSHNQVILTRVVAARGPTVRPVRIAYALAGETTGLSLPVSCGRRTPWMAGNAVRRPRTHLFAADISMQSEVLIEQSAFTLEIAKKLCSASRTLRKSAQALRVRSVETRNVSVEMRKRIGSNLKQTALVESGR